MISPGHIFCEPDFVSRLEEILPGQQIHGFSWEVHTVQEDIHRLDLEAGQQVWLLFSSAEGFDRNSPVMDHMNLCRENPLIGPIQGKGSRFPDMSSVYVDDEGIVAVLGEDEDLVNFDEPWVSVCGGIWEAIVLSQQGVKCRAWVVADLEKWIFDELGVGSQALGGS